MAIAVTFPDEAYWYLLGYSSSMAHGGHIDRWKLAHDALEAARPEYRPRPQHTTVVSTPQ